MGSDAILHPGTLALPAIVGPAALLDAQHEVVPFCGREFFAATMSLWCKGNVGGPLDVRILHAPCGSGKTRLAIHLCRQMREAGWRAGFLDDGARLAELLKGDVPVLAVIDDAELRSDVANMLAQMDAYQRAPPPRMPRARLLLLASNVGEWWGKFQRGDVEWDVRRLEPLEVEDREAIFYAAMRAFATAYGVAVDRVPAPDFEDPRYERVSLIEAAALAAVDGRRIDVDTLMDDTLDVEEHLWMEQLSARGHARPHEARIQMQTAVARMVLAGGVWSVPAIERIGGGDRCVTTLLRELYPGPAGLRGPDLFRDEMAVRLLRAKAPDTERCLDEWLAGLSFEDLFLGLAALARLSVTHPEGATWFAGVVARDLDGRTLSALTAAKTLPERAARAAGAALAATLERVGTLEMAREVAPFVSLGQTALSHVGRWAAAKELDALPLPPLLGRALRWLLGDRVYLPDDAERVQRLLDLSEWQNDLGQIEAALASRMRAIDMARELARALPEKHLSDLAWILVQASCLQACLNQPEAALALAEEALAIGRRAPENRYTLAVALHAVSRAEHALGRHKAALGAVQEAITLLGAQERTESFLLALADCFAHESAVRRALKQSREALKASREANKVCHALVSIDRIKYAPLLADNDVLEGDIRCDYGDYLLAKLCYDAAVYAYRDLAEQQPEEYLPRLAYALGQMGHVLAKRRPDEWALKATLEALDAIWPFFVERRNHVRTTRILLDNLASLSRTLGEPLPSRVVARMHAFDAQWDDA